MVILPDGTAIVMSWKQVKYINDKLQYQIELVLNYNF